MDVYRHRGVLVMDEPLRPGDALYSDIARKKINRNFDETIKKRLESSHAIMVITASQGNK